MYRELQILGSFSCFPVSCFLLFSLPCSLAAAAVAQVSFKPAQGIVLRYISEAEAAEFVIPPFEVGGLFSRGNDVRFAQLPPHVHNLPRGP